jgi:hypothetical protein
MWVLEEVRGRRYARINSWSECSGHDVMMRWLTSGAWVRSSCACGRGDPSGAERAHCTRRAVDDGYRESIPAERVEFDAVALNEIGWAARGRMGDRSRCPLRRRIPSSQCTTPSARSVTPFVRSVAQQEYVGASPVDSSSHVAAMESTTAWPSASPPSP